MTGSHLQFSSVQSLSHVWLCDPMNHSTPGLPVHHQLPEFTQIHVHWVTDAIQPSHPLSSSSPPAPNPSQHQGLFQWVNSLHEVAKVLEFHTLDICLTFQETGKLFYNKVVLCYIVTFPLPVYRGSNFSKIWKGHLLLLFSHAARCVGYLPLSSCLCIQLRLHSSLLHHSFSVALKIPCPFLPSSHSHKKNYNICYTPIHLICACIIAPECICIEITLKGKELPL